MGSFSHGSAMMSRGSSFAGAPHNNGVTFTTSRGNSHHYGHGGYGYHHHYRYGYGYGYGYGYPYYGYYGYDPLFWDSSSSYDSSEGYQQQNEQLSQQINELSNQVAQLREQQQIQSYTPSSSNRQTPPAAAKADPTATTVLIFRDQHREEISNYAVVGRTVWVFNEEQAKKIPLAELDVPATIKVNDDRGVDFNVPR